MRLLVLGGTHFVGRAVVEAALADGVEVTTLTSGASGPPTTGARPRYADRTDPDALREAIGVGEWDAVIDTWSGPPRAVRTTSRLLAGRVGHYGLVSSRSVYRWPIPVGRDESAPVVDGDPDAGSGEDYAMAKRGGELAALAAFGRAALIARAGLIIGRYENEGRLPYWLHRMARGGRVLAPGPADRPLQYLDVRDLAGWLLAMAGRRAGGVYNVVSRPGHATMGSLLESARTVTGGAAELVWVAPEVVESAGLRAWTELPLWAPPTGELAGLLDGDVSAAYAAGLTCRPVGETVADTWEWLCAVGRSPVPPRHGTTGLDPDREAEVLAALG